MEKIRTNNDKLVFAKPIGYKNIYTSSVKIK